MDLNIAMPNLQPGQSSTTGAMGFGDIEALTKALSAGYGTDVATLTGGGALRIQSLDKVMASTIQEHHHFRLFNALSKPKATATVDEWTEQNGVGGPFLGGSVNSETGNIANAQGTYNRRVGLVKYLMTLRQVSFVQTLQNTIFDSEAVEQQNGALQLLTDAEFLCFEGDSTVVPTEFDGIYAQLTAGIVTGDIDGSHVLDAGGQALASIPLITTAAANIAGFGNFGTPTDLFMSQLTQSDFDAGLDPAFRVPLTDVAHGGISLGSPVKGIRTSWGDIATKPDVFIRDEIQQMPFAVFNPALAAANVGLAPTSVTITQAANAASAFSAARAGNYYYYVVGVSQAGQSTGTVSAQTAVAAGNGVTLTIARSAGAQETGYAIYRGRLNGTNALNDLRLMRRIPSAGATTVYVDLNTDIPGTTKAYILNMLPSANAITWRQLLPMLKFPLYPTVSAVIPWAQLMFGFLRISKRRHHVVIKNIVPNGAIWQPFGSVGGAV
jgi:hypothetical protein